MPQLAAAYNAGILRNHPFVDGAGAGARALARGLLREGAHLSGVLLYGPGRYDPAYEEGGHDYPVGFVRSTEQRNFEVVLDMMADGRPDVKPLITHRFSIEDAEKACEVVGDSEASLIIRDSRLRWDTYASISSRTLCHRAASISPSFPPSLALSMQRI
jgi:hypothetical protein